MTCEKPHWDLCSDYNLIDFELGNKITGAGFPVYTNKGAKLQRALISYFLDKNTDAGYTEFQPPYLVNEASGALIWRGQRQRGGPLSLETCFMIYLKLIRRTGQIFFTELTTKV